VNIHVSYDRDEDSPPTESFAATENEQQHQQSSNTGESIGCGEGNSRVVEEVKPLDTSTREQEISAGQVDVAGKEEKSTEQQEIDQPSVDLSKQATSESHAEDTTKQDMPVSSEEVPAGNVVEMTQEQLLASDKQEEKSLSQTEDQPTKDSLTGASEDEEKPLPMAEMPPTAVTSENQIED